MSGTTNAKPAVGVIHNRSLNPNPKLVCNTEARGRCAAAWETIANQ